jgi:hypothetical protein
MPNYAADLFRIMAPFQVHSLASQEAAARIEQSCGRLQRQMLAWLRQRGKEGATDEEIQLGLPMRPSTQRPRRIELVELGLVEPSPLFRKTTSGRNARVWRAKP